MNTITETAIGTPARKIARLVNAASPGLAMHFDADGNLIESHEADLHYTSRPDWMEDVAITIKSAWSTPRGDHHYTYRDIQDRLDAHARHLAHADTCELYASDCKAGYLEDLRHGRQAQR